MNKLFNTKSLVQGVSLAAVASLGVNEAQAAGVKDRNPQNIPAMTDQIPDAQIGKETDGWNYVMNGKQFVVDQGKFGECPAVLINKTGTLNGELVSLFSLTHLPFDGKKYDPDKFHEVNLEAGTALVNGDRLYDYKSNTLAVDAQFIQAGLIQRGNDYIKLSTPRGNCQLIKNPDGTITVEPPPTGSGGCTDPDKPGCGTNGGGSQGSGGNPEGDFEEGSAAPMIKAKLLEMNRVVPTVRFEPSIG